MAQRRHSGDAPNTPDDVRIDKWLWAARFYKTRSLATQAIDGGHVKLNGQRCKPGRTVQTGDRVELTRGDQATEVIIQALSSLRGPAPVAQTLYAETPESMQRREAAAELRRLTPASAEVAGRPTKKDRRDIDRWKGRD